MKASLRQLFQKLEVHTRAQLVKIALEQYKDQFLGYPKGLQYPLRGPGVEGERELVLMRWGLVPFSLSNSRTSKEFRRSTLVQKASRRVGSGASVPKTSLPRARRRILRVETPRQQDQEAIRIQDAG